MLNIEDGQLGQAYAFEQKQNEALDDYFPNVILQAGGYGNIVFNIMFLMQMRLTKYFNGGKYTSKLKIIIIQISALIFFSL